LSLKQLLAHLYQQAFVTTLEKVPAASVPPVKVNALGHHQPVHPAAQIGPTRLCQQMKLLPI
jgi:hypothetical protein